MSANAKLAQVNNSRHAIRVLAIGDCNTCGTAVPPTGNTILDKFCRQLEADGHATRSQNLGSSMVTSREGMQFMQLKAKPADIVLINFGLVDTWITTIPKFYVPYFPDTWVRKRLRKLLKFVKRHLRSPWLRRFVPLGHVVSIDEYAQNIRGMISLARAKNPCVTILLWGSPPVQKNPARNADLERYNKQLDRVAHDTNTLFVSTAALVNKISTEAAYLDAVHLNEDATEAVAAQLAIVYRAQQLANAG